MEYLTPDDSHFPSFVTFRHHHFLTSTKNRSTNWARFLCSLRFTVKFWPRPSNKPLPNQRNLRFNHTANLPGHCMKYTSNNSIQSSSKIAPVISIFASKKVTGYEGLLFENLFDSQLSKIKNIYANKTVVLRSANHISCYTNSCTYKLIFISWVFSPLMAKLRTIHHRVQNTTKNHAQDKSGHHLLVFSIFFRFKF